MSEQTVTWERLSEAETASVKREEGRVEYEEEDEDEVEVKRVLVIYSVEDEVMNMKDE